MNRKIDLGSESKEKQEKTKSLETNSWKLDWLNFRKSCTNKILTKFVV